MMDFLGHILLEKTPQTLQGQCHSFHWQWLGEGLLSFTPNTSYKKSVIFSVGIHGNETAPIELLVQICQDIFAGLLPLNVRLLLVLGNPRAIRQGVRYIENDMNRMFYGKHLQYENSVETQRAQELEVVVKQFFEHTDVSISRYHYDLHTAIRRSLFQTFALLPYQKKVYDQILIESFQQGELIASQRSGNDIAEKNQIRILFPNIHVKNGLRAGLILEEVERK